MIELLLLSGSAVLFYIAFHDGIWLAAIVGLLIAGLVVASFRSQWRIYKRIADAERQSRIDRANLIEREADNMLTKEHKGTE